MKIVILGVLVFLIVGCLFAATDYSSKAQGVMVMYRDGKTEKAKLNSFNANEVVIFTEASNKRMEQVTIPRAKVNGLSFDEQDHTNRFGSGEEGFVMKDGRVLKGIAEGLDSTTFWRRLSPGGKTERLDRDQVLFIQFRKAQVAEPEPPGRPQKTTVDVAANQAWTVTNVSVKKGQKVSFHVDATKPIMCGGAANINADGVNPFTPDPKRPLNQEKACALIARIGNDVFRVGTVQTPFDVKQNGQLVLGINDWKFTNNFGVFSVLITVEP